MGHSKADIDGYTIAQGRLFLKEGALIQRRARIQLAEAVVACAFDEKAWERITEDLF